MDLIDSGLVRARSVITFNFIDLSFELNEEEIERNASSSITISKNNNNNNNDKTHKVHQLMW